MVVVGVVVVVVVAVLTVLATTGCAGILYWVLSSTLLEALETALDALGALVIFVPDSRVAMVSALISAAVWELALASRPANRNSFRIMSSNVSFDGLHTCLLMGSCGRCACNRGFNWVKQHSFCEARQPGVVQTHLLRWSCGSSGLLS